VIVSALAQMPRRLYAMVVLAGVVAAAISFWSLDSGTAGAPSVSSATAARGDIVVSVGGVGRIVESRSFGDIALPQSGKSSSSTTSADSVFPRAPGQIARYLVQPGQRVRAGAALALLDDGGLSASAIQLARNDLAVAQLELRQKQTHDPLRGTPATPQEIAAGAAAIPAAEKRLARVAAGARPADVRAAEQDVERAQADLETLLGGSSTARADGIAVAQGAADAAQAKLDKLLAPPNPADVAAALAELKKAESDLAVLNRAPQGPSSQSVTAAQSLVNSTRTKLDTLTADPASTPADIAAAQADSDKAVADLAALQQAPRGPLWEETQAAQQAVESAKAKLARVQAPADPSDVAAASAELSRARADLRARQAGPTSASVTAARAAVSTAKAKLTQLLAGPIGADVATARVEVVKAKADLAALRARSAPASSIDVAVARLKVAAAADRLANARLTHSLLTVRAPASGTVTSLLSVPGAPVDATTPVATVADLDHLSVNVALSEFDAAEVHRGLAATVSVDALGGQKVPGKVTFAALTGTDNAGVVTFPVRVDIRRMKGLRPGMNVSVRIILEQAKGVVTVPVEAVAGADGENPTVTVMTASGKTKVQKVELGIEDNKSVQIVSGIRAGEQVVLPGSEGA
jgi:HlyD family secretion protein